MQRERMKLLLVEDDRDSAEALLSLFDLHDIETVWSVDGPSALDTLDRIQRLGERPPDFALLDLNLPNTDTIRHGREMMSHPSGCPVVLVSASSSQVLEESTRELGAAGCLRKPFQMDSLLAMLRKHYTLGESGFSDRPAARR